MTFSQGLEAEQGVVSGAVSLTPIQGWFFEQALPEPQHFNQAVLLEVEPELEPVWVQRVVGQLLGQHDALRLRFTQEGGQWRQVNAGREGAVPFAVVDLSGLAEARQRPALEAVAAAQQVSLSLTSGPLVRVVLFKRGAERPGRLLLVVHHLAVDGVSWRVLLEDFQRAYEQLSRGEAIELPPKTTAFKEWAGRLGAYGQSAAVREELDYWRGVTRGVKPLPRDYPADPAANTVAAAAEVVVALSPEQTRALLQEVPPVYHTQINDVLLTALVQSMAHWTGERTLLLDLEGHGREELFEGVDLARTVGWFTTLFPVCLALETEQPGEALKAVKEQLRGIPKGGIGYGVLRYLHPEAEVRTALHGLPQAEVSFNYLGQLDAMLSGSSLLRPAPESSGLPHRPRGHLLDINGFVAGGRLQLQWTYSTRVHRRATVEHLARWFLEALEGLIAHCQSPEAGGFRMAPAYEEERAYVQECGRMGAHSSRGVNLDSSLFLYTVDVERLSSARRAEQESVGKGISSKSEDASVFHGGVEIEASLGRGRQTVAYRKNRNELENPRQLWRRSCGSYRPEELRAITFDSREERKRAIHFILTDPHLKGMPMYSPNGRTFFVPIEAVTLLGDRGLTFSVSELLGPDDLLPGELAEMRRKYSM